VIPRRVTVCCPSSIVTGGPEALHQLVDALRSFGHDAHIAYYPFDGSFECPEPYRRYNAPQARLTDDIGDLVIVPETATYLLLGIRNADVGVWWLSVDNYLGKVRKPEAVDLLAQTWRLLRRRKLPIWRMRGFRHFAQSQYAHEFLSRSGILAPLLSDYLGAEHLERPAILLADGSRRDIVAYNPRRGLDRTRRLREANPDVTFVPIEEMTNREVRNLLATAKVYVDFGNHPGKDRLPREAAIAGCCVVTGRQGAANNGEDIPVSDEYKLCDATDAYIRAFTPLVQSIFADFPGHASRFAAYRQAIISEPDIFRGQVLAIFGDPRCM
jgi:hypothetical protein